LAGDAAFGPDSVEGPTGPRPGPNTFVTCQAISPEVAFVEFLSPRNALPGSTFDAIATVHADDGSFADGTVKLHGEVIKPVLAVDKRRVDFGNVAPEDNPTIPLQFTRVDVNALSLLPVAEAGSSGAPGSYAYPPFVISGPTLAGSDAEDWNVTLETNVPGDYSATVDWRAMPIPASRGAPRTIRRAIGRRQSRCTRVSSATPAPPPIPPTRTTAASIRRPPRLDP
jgi:hypothetical protein